MATAEISQRVQWVVCESATRWRRTVGRFILTASGLDQRSALRVAKVSEVRALAVQVRPLVILWEFQTSKHSLAVNVEVIRTLAALSKVANPPLQFVGMQANWDLSNNQFNRLAVMLRALGAAAVMRGPEEFPALVRLVYPRRGPGMVPAWIEKR